MAKAAASLVGTYLDDEPDVGKSEYSSWLHPTATSVFPPSSLSNFYQHATVMQGLWSRAAQTRSCRCNSGLHSATTLARRTTTAASKRRLKPSDVFTACYSAIFATAALADAKFKEDRRKQWDRAIEEAKAGNGAARTDDSVPALDREVCKVDLSYAESARVEKEIPVSSFGAYEHTIRCPASVTDLTSRTREHIKETPLETQLRILDSHLRQALPTCGVQAVEDLQYYPVQIVKVDVEDCRLLPREPKSRRHLDHMQEMVANLVTRLLLNCNFLLLREGPLKSTSSTSPLDDLNLQRKIMAERLASLRTSKTRLPAYSLSNNDMEQDRKSLNEAIEAVLAKNIHPPGSKSFDIMMAKICYNLLVSAAPPSIDTYNIMLTYFTRMQQHKLGQAMVDSFLLDSRLRPNENTISAILDHYTALGDKPGFRSIVQRMNGTDGDMRIKRRHICSLDHPVVQSMLLKGKCIHRDGFLRWKVPRNANIFESLIRGSLKLFGIRRANIAAMYVKTALREGCSVSSDLFIEVAQACLAAKCNPRAAMSLVHGVASAWQRLGDHACSIECDAAVRKYLYTLMDFCGIEHSIYGGVRQELVPSLKKIGFRLWLRNLRLESINADLERCAHRILRLNKMLTSFLSGKSTCQQLVDRMIRYLERDLDANSHRAHRKRRALLSARQSALAGSAAKLKDLEQQLTSVIYEALPSHCQGAYNDIVRCTPRMNGSKRLKVILDLHLNKSDITEHRSLDNARDPCQITFAIAGPTATNPMEPFYSNSGLVGDPQPRLAAQ